MTRPQRLVWLERIGNWERNFHNTVRKQLLVNGYKYLVKALFLVACTQLPDAVKMGFDCVDHDNRMNSLNAFIMLRQRGF